MLYSMYSIFRRMKSGHSLPPAPLPLMCARVEAPAAHGSAPGWAGPAATGVSRGPGALLRLPKGAPAEAQRSGFGGDKEEQGSERNFRR